MAKLRAGARARDALHSYGMRPGWARAALWAAAIAAEAGLGAAVAARAPGAALGAAGLLALFVLALVSAIARGRTGSPCGCFGTRSRIGWPAALRTGLLAAAFAALTFLPDAHPSTDAWLGLGLAVSLA